MTSKKQLKEGKKRKGGKNTPPKSKRPTGKPGAAKPKRNRKD